ncbi:sulfate adenylyltransferase [Helicobacter muridarum]|uniref:Sulfate adenylyltransferase n=1 Tax=Helicobacter muridarum TaxID=216 RepID=A0A099TZM0_9HELI|nr:sulfate adenylyltransferase [Helicobacter muridarum]TLE00501.1 sulfate adenylyltransferase [Helicobacter muridarum]STQ86477.1 sulfate adenylyltransferase [Helicobacter muridarum]
MESQGKNKQLYIDKEAISVLNLAKEGLLYPATRLMNEKQMQEINKTGMYLGQSYPCPFLLNPSGRRNKEVLEQAKSGDIIDFITDGKKSGSIVVDSVFSIDKQERLSKIMGGDFASNPIKDIEGRIGNLCICGDYTLEENQIEKHKKKLAQRMEILNAKNIMGVVMQASPLHRVHEKIMREALGNCDLLVIFLSRPRKGELLDYRLRLKCMEFLIDNYLMKEKVLIIPHDDTYLYAGQNKMIMHAVVARNFGCNKFLVGENNRGLSVYYLNNQVHSIFDSLQGISIDVQILPEYVYCDICKTLVSTRTCPHGHHHHINYNAESFIEFFRLGLLPPAMLIRKQISAIILSSLFPNRFKDLDRLYYDILPSNGIIQNKGEEEFYLKLMRLYQTTSLN